MTKMTASKVRKEFGRTLDRTARKGTRVVIQKRGKDVAAIISIEDLALLEEMEDRIDAKLAEEAIKEAERDGAIPWKVVKEELELGK